MICVSAVFLGYSNLGALMRVYADLVIAMKPCVHSVADHCLSLGLISEYTYDIIMQHDLIDSDKARILHSSINRDAISQKTESLRLFITVMSNIGDFDNLVHRLENTSV